MGGGSHRALHHPATGGTLPRFPWAARAKKMARSTTPAGHNKPREHRNTPPISTPWGAPSCRSILISRPSFSMLVASSPHFCARAFSFRSSASLVQAKENCTAPSLRPSASSCARRRWTGCCRRQSILFGAGRADPWRCARLLHCKGRNGGHRPRATARVVSSGVYCSALGGRHRSTLVYLELTAGGLPLGAASLHCARQAPVALLADDFSTDVLRNAGSGECGPASCTWYFAVAQVLEYVESWQPAPHSASN